MASIPVLVLVAFGLDSAHAGRADTGAMRRPTYRLRAFVAGEPPQVAGRVAVDFTNASPRAIDEVFLFLFANRFSQPDEGVNDFNRPFVYPEQEFDPGGMVIDAAFDGATLVRTAPVARPGLPLGTVARMHVAPIAPGENRTLTFEFRTRIPHRFGSFGEFEGQLTLVGGWYPHLARLNPDGTWALDTPPEAADFEVELDVPAELEVVLGGRHFAAGEKAAASFASLHYLSLIAAPGFLRSEASAGGSRIVFLHRPARWTSRISPEPATPQAIVATLRDIVDERNAAVPAPPEELVVVQAPLRLNLFSDGEGAVVLSDRALKVHSALRPFHDLQLAQAVYGELLRPALVAREPERDYWWVSEGAARLLARRFFDRARTGTRSVRDWIELFNIFAVVDRFENEPKIPFVGAFFEGARLADPLRTEIATFNGEAPPGRVTMSKLRDLIGPAAFDPELDRCLAAPIPFRECMAEVLGDHHLDALLALWLAPYPDVNYRFEDVAFNEPDFERRRTTVTVRRQSSSPFVEPVTVRLRTLGGEDVDLQWKSGGEVARMSAATERRVIQTTIDPDRKLIETRRDDNSWPPTPQVVLDTADVEVSSTEFAISGLVVGRARYDYRKDLAVAGFFTNRGGGFTAGGRYHWGTPVDATTYRHNVYGFYGLQALDGDFKEDKPTARRTDGLLGSVGLRYDYTNVFSYDDPSHQRTFRLYADWYDEALGSDFQYADWGYAAAATHPLLTDRTVGALQLLNGFGEAIGDSQIPNQGLYSLGGSRSIRGIDAEDDLGENILVLRTELRQDIYPEVDLNFLDLVVLRRTQLRFFVDSGRVSDRVESVYRVDRFAAGVGIGFEAFYEFLGFFPASAYIELATRVDEPSQSDDVQVLFGTRQAF